jgi:hypothetical protein
MVWREQDPPATDVLLYVTVPFSGGGSPAYLEIDKLTDGTGQRLGRCLKLWSVALNPPPDGRVVDHDAAFRHHLLELAIADGVFAVPAHALQDDEGMEAAELEGVHAGLSRSDRGLRYPTSSLTLANAT